MSIALPEPIVVQVACMAKAGAVATPRVTRRGRVILCMSRERGLLWASGPGSDDRVAARIGFIPVTASLTGENIKESTKKLPGDVRGG
jgi:hypothetical protein